MLVLVSFGLVLLATILLVVGLLNDDGLTLIYLSIAASATAAVVLYVAFRRARPSAETTTAAPAPLADDIVAPTEAASEEQTAVTPAVTTSPPPAPEPAPEPEPEPSYAASDDDWMSDAEWEGDIEFPIADYDDLTVAEIMPLLPQLYSDELDDVIERERSGKNRATILDRLEELKQIGTDADTVEAELEGEPTPQPAPDTAAGPGPAPAPLGGGTSLLDLDDEDEDEELFPIADYDGLSVSQIVPLLSQLEVDELEEVRAREVNGAGRKTLITEIDALLPGASAEPAPAPAAAPSPSPAPPEESAATGKKAATRKAASKKKATAKKTRTKKKAATRKAASKKKATTKKKASKKKAATKKAAASRFPIANYDELKVAEIRPRLSELSERQLEQVRERELSGAGRKTILDEIDRKLS